MTCAPSSTGCRTPANSPSTVATGCRTRSGRRSTPRAGAGDPGRDRWHRHDGRGGAALSRQFRMAEAERQLRSIGMTRGQVVADQLVHAAVPVVAGTSLAVGLAHAASGLFPRGFVLHVEPDPAAGSTPWSSCRSPWPSRSRSLLGARRRRRIRGRAAGGRQARSWTRRRSACRCGWRRPLRFALVHQARDSTRPKACASWAWRSSSPSWPGTDLGASLDRLGRGQPAGAGTSTSPSGRAAASCPTPCGPSWRATRTWRALSLFGAVVATAGTEGFDVAGVPPVVGSTEPHFFEGRLPMGDDEIVVGRAAARRLGVGVGDELVVTGPAGDGRCGSRGSRCFRRSRAATAWARAGSSPSTASAAWIRRP